MKPQNDNVRGSNKPKKSQTTINQLALELLSKIFSYIPLLTLCQTVALVCHQWNDIVKYRSRYQAASLSEQVLKDPKEFVQKWHKDICILKMSYYKQWELLTTSFAVHWDSLTKLHLDHLKIRHSNIFAFANHCPNLTCLKINFSEIEIRDPSNRHHFTGPNKLEHLSLLHTSFDDDAFYIENPARDTRITNFGKALNSIETYCTQLNYLNLISYDIYPSELDFQTFLSKRCKTIRGLHVYSLLRNSEVLKLIGTCVQLKSLTLESVNIWYLHTQKNIIDIATLKYLNIYVEAEIEVLNIQYMFQTKNNIEHLSIYQDCECFDNFEYHLFPSIATACPNLISFSVARCPVTDEDIELLCKFATKLESLILINTRITGTCLRKLSKLHLKQIYIRYYTDPRYNRRFPQVNTDLITEYENATGKHINYKERHGWLVWGWLLKPVTFLILNLYFVGVWMVERGRYYHTYNTEEESVQETLFIYFGAATAALHVVLALWFCCSAGGFSYQLRKQRRSSQYSSCETKV